jgi:hypothetical protein
MHREILWLARSSRPRAPGAPRLAALLAALVATLVASPLAGALAQSAQGTSPTAPPAADTTRRDRTLLERIEILESQLAEGRRRDSLAASRLPVVGAGTGGFSSRSACAATSRVTGASS